jgi:hypothetical protein
VSLLLGDSMHISLSPTKIGYAQIKAGFKPALLRQQTWPINQPLTPDVNNQADSFSLSMLDDTLNKVTAKKKISVVLSNQYVRYLVLPALPILTKKKGIADFAKHAFMEAFGEASAHWTIVVNPFNHGKSLLVCATPTQLIQQLQTKCQQLKFKLNTIQPYLMAGFNLIRKKSRHTLSCLVQVESDGFLIALIAEQSWVRVVYFKQTLTSAAMLKQIIQREMLLAEWPNQAVSLFTFGLPMHFNMQDARWRHERIIPKQLIGMDSSIDDAVVMALGGLN